MRVIIYNTQIEANTRSRLEATNRGCKSTTIAWWDIVEGVNGKYGILIGVDIVPETVTEIDETWIKLEEKI